MTSPRAFSLVEVVLALAILAFGIVVLVALLPIGLQTEQTSAQETVAINIIQSFGTDLANSPATNPKSTRYLLAMPATTPLPAPPAATPTPANYYLTDDQTVTGTAAGAAFHVLIRDAPQSEGSVFVPAMLIQVFGPGAVSSQGPPLAESLVTFAKTSFPSPNPALP